MAPLDDWRTISNPFRSVNGVNFSQEVCLKKIPSGWYVWPKIVADLSGDLELTHFSENLS